MKTFIPMMFILGALFIASFIVGYGMELGAGMAHTGSVNLDMVRGRG